MGVSFFGEDGGVFGGAVASGANGALFLFAIVEYAKH